MKETEILRTMTITVRSSDYEILVDYVVTGDGPNWRMSATHKRVAMCAKTVDALVNCIKTAIDFGAPIVSQTIGTCP